MKKLIWHGHGCWSLEIPATKLIVDPFLSDEVLAEKLEADFILVSHGHGDHTAHVEKIAKRTGASIIGIPEICSWFEKRGVKNTLQMNIGGMINIPGGCVLMTPAWHSSSMPDGSNGGAPCGFMVSIDGDDVEKTPIRPLSLQLERNMNVYFACDTGLFSEMEWLGSFGIEVAVLPIGDLFTMGPSASLEAIQLLKPKKVLPSHYGTWPPIDQVPEAWADAVRKYTESEPHVLQPGECFCLGKR